MHQWTLALGLLCACLLPAIGNAELNDRTKKLLQSQALSRPPADTMPKKSQTPNDAASSRDSGPTRAVPAPPSGSRGPVGNVPARKP
ncbi:MAG: hypothetical protein QOG17_2810 [Gammaproteobacteria bacterium]|jgi:hypothetical protein|nr:hypothetical protein [Gammaproteobacteria bacterium]